jgi:hypothetical protein
MIFSFVVPLAAFEAGNAAFHRMHASQCGAALAASVKILSLELDAFQREIVAPGFVWDSQIAAGPTPLGAMRGNVPPPGTMLGQKMGELMTQGSLDFGRRDFDQFRIEGDRPGPPACEASGRPKPGFPSDGHLESRAIGGTQELAAKLFEEEVALEAPLAWLITGIRGVGKEA